jgi:hypothetical protein
VPGKKNHRVNRWQQVLTVAVDRDVLIGPAEKRQSRFVRVRSASGSGHRKQAQDRADRRPDPTLSCDHNVLSVRGLPNVLQIMIVLHFGTTSSSPW